MDEVVEDPGVEPTVFHGMVTVSPVMEALFELLGRVARTQASVLLRGETGTGKELAAAAVHALSSRANGPFRAINCAMLTPDLAASELFGHVRGAFTGAVSKREGQFALADGGTIFLDEVAELPLDIQARLLRVLQNGTYIPVGGTDPETADVRLITATHRSLREEAEAGRFREDLMYRVRVVPVFIPPLVERSGDIEMLTWHFIRELNARGRRNIRGVSREALDLMLDYQWPGNVRELSNVIEYAFAVGPTDVITAGDLPPELRGELPPHREETSSDPEHAEKARIREALRLASGQKSQAAELLGISRTTLWRRMRELRIREG